jgi:hypothetical protein
MLDAIIAAVGSITGTVSAAVIPLWIQNRKLKSRIEGAPEVARGLAVGYFYNFLKPVGDVLRDEILQVRFDPDETQIERAPGSAERVRQFKKEEVEIVLIAPRRLSAASITHATDEVKNARDAAILRLGGGRPFTIKYDLERRRNDLILVIKDLVRPYFAIKYYAEEYLKADQDSEHWRNLERDTLREFHETIENLRSKGEGVGINKILWKEIE